MKTLLTKIKGASLPVKLLIGAAVLVALLYTYDVFTGQISDLKSYLWNSRSAVRTEKEIQLEQENAVLRAEKEKAEKMALEEKAKRVIYEEKDKNLENKAKVELTKLEKALEEQSQEEAITAEVKDNYTRCLSLKDKMIKLGSITARSINCDEYKQ